jgi:PRTRC genetic system protein B
MRTQLRIEAPRAASLILAEAVLLYREQGHDATRAYASVHPVEVTDGRPTIPPPGGRPAGPPTRRAATPRPPRAARRLARELTDQTPGAAAFLDGRTLYAGDALLAWWLPAGVRHVAFRCPELGERGEAVPHPALVFAVSAKGWWVWACHDDARPTPQTPLHRAPYFNVGDDGAICQGSTVLPSGEERQRIDAWSGAFFGSFFSHPSGRQLVRHPGGAYAFWKAMLEAPPERFPAGVLVPMDTTLGDAMSRIGGQHD